MTSRASVDRDVEKRRRGPLAQGYGGEQGQQPEGPAAAGAEVGVGDLDGVADADVAGAELVEAQPVGQFGQGPVAVGGQPGGDQAHGQRQAAAGPDDPAGGVRLVLDPAGADPADEQFAQRVVVEAADGEGVGLQQAQRPPAGDHGRAAAHPGQQRTHLCGGLGVVEHDQDPAPDEAIVVEPPPGLLLRRHLPGPDAERGEQAGPVR